MDAYRRQSEELWKVSLNRRPFECLSRKQVQEKLSREKQDLASMRRACRATKRMNKEMESTIAVREKQIDAQRFVMNNLRNGIDYLKDQCNRDDPSGEVSI